VGDTTLHPGLFLVSVEKADTPILSGMQIFHNYLRPHEALNGKTPADIAGKVEGENKWLTLIERTAASKEDSAV